MMEFLFKIKGIACLYMFMIGFTVLSQSDKDADKTNIGKPEKTVSIDTTITVSARYLIWPVRKIDSKNIKYPRSRIFLYHNDNLEDPFNYFWIDLAQSKPDFWVFTDLTHYQGQTITIKGRIKTNEINSFKKVRLSDTVPGMNNVYQEKLRPQYHFTSKRGWLNDPNGLMYYKGIWHLFYQHNPYNTHWSNMTWGHATSKDLFTWQEQPSALFPDREGMMFSGSGFVNHNNSGNFRTGKETPLMLAYTGFNKLGLGISKDDQTIDQGLAFSNDGGKTFQKYAGNPVLPHVIDENRDPKVFWYEPEKHWVLVMSLSNPDQTYGIFISKNLKKWEHTQTYKIPPGLDCPDLFPLAIDGNPNTIKWIAWSAHGLYLIGDFNGKRFESDGNIKKAMTGTYAGQTFDNAPGERRIQIGFIGTNELPGMPFRQLMSIPVEFSLRTTPDGLRLWAEPVKEAKALRTASVKIGKTTIVKGTTLPVELLPDSTSIIDRDIVNTPGDLVEIEAVFSADSDANAFGLRLFGIDMIYDKNKKKFSNLSMNISPIDHTIHIHVFVDRIIAEVFVNGNYSARKELNIDNSKIELVSLGGSAILESLIIHRLRSSWPKISP